MKYYIDMHCHVLPGIDDGAKDIEISKEMMMEAYKDGIREMIVTPHNKAHRHSAGKETIEGLTQKLQNWLDEEKIAIKLHTGNEVLYRQDMGELLNQDQICTMAGSKYVLIEFNPGDPYSYIRAGVQEVLMTGYWPIVAHVERYEAIVSHEERIEELIEMGAFIQVNAKSVTKKPGLFQKNKVVKWIERGNVHFVASDAHNLDDRPQHLDEAARLVEQKCGAEVAERIFYENQTHVIRGELIR